MGRPPKTDKLILKHFNLSEELSKRLDDFAAQKKVSRSDIVRLALKDFLETHLPQSKK